MPTVAQFLTSLPPKGELTAFMATIVSANATTITTSWGQILNATMAVPQAGAQVVVLQLPSGVQVGIGATILM